METKLEMKKTEEKILSILCPICKEHEMVLKRDFGLSKAETNFYWKCPECVYRWEEEWFNTFPQFEHLIERIE